MKDFAERKGMVDGWGLSVPQWRAGGRGWVAEVVVVGDNGFAV